MPAETVGCAERVLHNGQAEIDNNIAENTLRGVAVGLKGWGVSLVSRCLRVSRAQLHVILRRTDDWMAAAVVTLMIRMCFSVYTMLSESCPRMVIVGYGRCFADRQNLMVCLISMPNVFTGSCSRMRYCLSENLLYHHRNGHIQAEWP